MLLSAASAGGAVACYAKAEQLRTEAKLLMARGNAQGAEYVSTFDGQYADQQARSYDDSRTMKQRAVLWDRGRYMLILSIAVFAIAAYCLFLMARLREQVLESTELDHGERANPIPQSR
jgi:hypothetical protein